MIFEFFKKLFWKADEGGRKRKANDSVFHSEDDNTHSKKRCHDFASSNHIKIINDSKDNSNTVCVGENPNLCQDSLLRLTKTRRKTMDIKQFDLLESPIDWPSTIKTGFIEKNKSKPKTIYSSLPKCESINHLTLYKAHRLAEKKQYSEMLLNFVPLDTQKVVNESRKSMSQEIISKIDLSDTNNTPLARYSLPKKVSDDRSYKPSFSVSKPSLKMQESIESDIENENEKMESNVKSVSRTPIEVIKINTLRDEFSTRDVMKQDFLSQISKRYNERMEQRNKEAEELKKMTNILSKHNRITREATLEDYLNRSMRLCEAILDESDLDKDTKLPELSSDMLKKIQRALSSGAENEILVQGFGLRITRRDIQTLAGLNWLNDEVINFYMNLLITRGNDEKYPNVYAMNTFFYPKLVSSGHASLKRWTRKVDIFAKDLLVVPIHLGMHWCMSIIDFRNKSIQYYDSMGSENNKCLQVLKQYLCDESIDKKKKPLDLTDWTSECVKDIPQQMNGSDCGVFSCMFAEYICANKRLNFSQEDMPYFRNKMVYEILTTNLL